MRTGRIGAARVRGSACGGRPGRRRGSAGGRGCQGRASATCRPLPRTAFFPDPAYLNRQQAPNQRCAAPFTRTCKTLSPQILPAISFPPPSADPAIAWRAVDASPTFPMSWPYQYISPARRPGITAGARVLATASPITSTRVHAQDPFQLVSLYATPPCRSQPTP